MMILIVNYSSGISIKVILTILANGYLFSNAFNLDLQEALEYKYPLAKIVRIAFIEIPEELLTIKT